MAALPIALIAIAATIGIGAIVALALLAAADLRATLRRAPLAHLRAALPLRLVAAITPILALPAGARQFAHARADGAPTLEPSTWAIVGLPASVAALAFAILTLRHARAPDHHARLLLASAGAAGTLILLLAFAGRLTITDALLITAAVPAWMWLLTESPSRERPHHPPSTHGTPGPTPLRPPAPILLTSLIAAAALTTLSLDPALTLGVDLATAAALAAILFPIALAPSRGTDPARTDHAAAILFVAATVPPLAALAVPAITRVALVVDHAGDETHLNGFAWHVGAIEALAAGPYLPGLARAVTPALLLLALPLLHLALPAISDRVRRLVAVAVLAAGAALAITGLAGAH